MKLSLAIPGTGVNMRRIHLLIAAVMTASSAQARDADSIVFGSQLDALIEYGEALQGAAEDSTAGPAVADPDPAEDRRDIIRGKSATEADGDEGDGNELNFVLRQGYDDNYDESTEPEASSFTEIVSTASWAQESAEGGVYAQLGATLIRLHDLDWKERGDAFLDLGLRREVRDGLAFQAGLGLSVDATSDPYEGAGRATVGLEGTQQNFTWGLRANLSAEKALKAREPDEDVPAGTYDFQRPEIEGSVLLNPDSSISPFVSASLSRIAFPLALPEGITNDDDEIIASPLRDARQVSVSAGLRLKPVDDLTIRVGVRGNLRQFDQDDLEDLATVGPQLAVEWKISPALSLTGTLDRTIGEPEELSALAEDATTASATITFQAMEAMELSATGAFERTTVYGVQSGSDETSVDLAAVYRLNARAALQVNYYHLWYTDRVGSDDYSRSRISGGGSLTF